MRKKRRFIRKKRGKRSIHRRQNEHDTTLSSSKDPLLPPGHNRFRSQILTLLYSNDGPIQFKQTLKLLSLPSQSRKALYSILTDLCHDQILKQMEKDLYGPGKKHNLAEGILDQNAKGFGFVTSLSSKLQKTDYTKDAFISPANMHTARHGDKVLIRIFKVTKDGRPEAEILSILERSSSHLAGFVTFRSGQTIVYPEDTRFPFTIRIPGKRNPALHEGDAVIVKLDETTDTVHQQTGSLLEILGSPDLVDVQMRLVIEKHSLPHTFSTDTLQEIEKIPDTIGPEKDRLDLRELQHITIDGESAKDFDDAICVFKTRKGFRLYVSIADVSHYVKPGSALDKDAYQRGTSIYFPGRVIPMLPEKLSNDLCSLVPDKDRYCFTAILDFDRTGQLQNKEFTKSIIRSKQRFTYTTVSQIIEKKDSQTRKKYKEFVTPLKCAAELAAELMKNRKQRGAIGFTLPEPFMELDDQGKITSIRRAERNFAHKLIEEFMLTANEAVAQLFTAKKLDGLYRIHEQPALEKVTDFIEFSNSLGLHLPPFREDPSWFDQIIDMVQSTPKEYVINNLLLRTMQQAKYDANNVGHFGLAATDYTHFTSPIRRYPDLTVHRVLHTFLTQKTSVRTRKKDVLSNKEMGPFLSARERVAVAAEREMNERLKVRFMSEKIGETFNAVISGVTGTVIFIELTDLFISGGISITSLKDDHYMFNAKQHKLTGKLSGKSFQIGDLLQVILIDVDLRQNRIFFGPARSNEQAT